MLLLRFGLHTLLNKAADDDADDSRHDNICLFFLGGGDISSFVPLSNFKVRSDDKSAPNGTR